MDILKEYQLPQTPVLETKHLVLIELTTSILNYIFTALPVDKQIAVMGAADEAAIETWKMKLKGGLETYRIKFQNFLMIEKLSGKTIGSIGYHYWHYPHNKAEIGYAIYDEANRQKGYMSEAMKDVIIYGFEKMDLNRVEAFLSPQNIPSKKLVEKYGFQREGLLREHFLKDGILEDSACYSLLKKEYEGLKENW